MPKKWERRENLPRYSKIIPHGPYSGILQRGEAYGVPSLLLAVAAAYQPRCSVFGGWGFIWGKYGGSKISWGIWHGYLARALWFSCGAVRLVGGSISFCPRFIASIGEVCVLGVGLGIKLWFNEILRFSWYSPSLWRLVTQQIYTMFITNNQASFYLWK